MKSLPNSVSRKAFALVAISDPSRLDDFLSAAQSAATTTPTRLWELMRQTLQQRRADLFTKHIPLAVQTRSVTIKLLAYAEALARMSGGYDATILSVSLESAPDPFSGPLVLRLFQATVDAQRASREAAVQNALADLGYPAPRVFVAEAAEATDLLSDWVSRGEVR
jgi:hypothetical protein